MMTISLDSVTHSARCGYITLQVPDTQIVVTNVSGSIKATAVPASSTPNPVSVPDDYFCRLKNCAPVVGKEYGFLYLTKKGFRYFYRDIKKAFEEAIKDGRDRTGGVGWPAFVKHAKDHFATVDRNRNRKIAELTKKITQYKAFVV